MRVALADDSLILREGLARLLEEADFEVVAQAATAEELLELTDHPVEWIAAEVGFGNAATLRHHFTRTRGVSPQQYRRQFAC